MDAVAVLTQFIEVVERDGLSKEGSPKEEDLGTLTLYEDPSP